MPDFGRISHGLLTSGTDPLAANPAAKSDSGFVRPLVQVAGADGNRIATILNPVPSDWVITRVTVQCDTAGSIAKLYVGSPSPLNLVSVDKYGDGDDLDLFNPLYIPQGTPFCVQWDSGTPNTCYVRVEFQAVNA